MRTGLGDGANGRADHTCNASGHCAGPWDTIVLAMALVVLLERHRSSPVAAVHVHAAAAAISVPAAAAIAAAATRDAAGAILATDEPKARWAWPSSKKSGPRMPFLAAYLPRLSEVYSRTYECRASFRPATRGMVEVSPKVYRRMTPFWQLHPNWPLQGDSH